MRIRIQLGREDRWVESRRFAFRRLARIMEPAWQVHCYTFEDGRHGERYVWAEFNVFHREGLDTLRRSEEEYLRGIAYAVLELVPAEVAP